MSWTLLILLSPLFVLILVFGVVVIVALTQARDEDVPAVWSNCVHVFSALARHVPTTRASTPSNELPSSSDAAPDINQ